MSLYFVQHGFGYSNEINAVKNFLFLMRSDTLWKFYALAYVNDSTLEAQKVDTR
jgi:hypothetical protein